MLAILTTFFNEFFRPILIKIWVNGHLWWLKWLKLFVVLPLLEMKKMNKKSAFIAIVRSFQKRVFTMGFSVTNVPVVAEDVQLLLK
jgi:hypothetical protein